MIGIYKITNKLNGMIYIGESVRIERRFMEHNMKSHNSQLID
jgi:predicted GIY-YIG superfamily endonuclease